MPPRGDFCYLCKQFGPDQARQNEKKSSIQRVKYDTNIKCEGIIKAIENPKADQNTFLGKYVIFDPPRLLLANDFNL